MYPKDFIKLQLDFARKASEITGENMTAAILKYTNIYLMFGLDFDFDTKVPRWQEYLKNFKPDTDYTYEFYKKTQSSQPKAGPPLAKKPKGSIDKYKEIEFGCFSYSIQPEKQRAWIHISNNEKSGFGPFSTKRLGIRKEEMTEMLKHIEANEEEIKFIRETSWLFAHENHNKVFPPEFVKNAEIEEGGDLQFLSSWGQFIDSSGNLRNELSDQFKYCFIKQNAISDMVRCFPYRVKTSELTIEKFYTFYKIHKQ
ncbi:MAG: hypothetical protein PHS44_06805 [Candidatus Dojkabacteria bacterium]|jgi:hypothetical protein|nr:hypothetical protein [Candidatus Dojkabacteria bacterium]